MAIGRWHVIGFLWLGCMSAVARPAPVLASADADSSLTTEVISLDGTWSLAIDPKNVGREEAWFKEPRGDAKNAKVPWIIQDAFPEYHGVAWYWRTFTPPANPHAQGRYLLRFWQVDYLAEVWVNGKAVGGHEGGEGPFVLDVTDAIQPGKANRLAVRVLNPTNEPIDGIALAQVPRRCKVVPFNAGALYNDGGIVDSVELLVAPAVRLTDLQLCPDWKTGEIRARAIVRNALATPVQGRLEFAVAPASSGVTLNVAKVTRELPPGDTPVDVVLQVNGWRLWELNDPSLYRVSVRVGREGTGAFDELSSRCGFRDFRFEDGYFRLNGKRVFVKCAHTSTHYPIGQHWPHDPDLARRDLLNLKASGFNTVRFFCSVPTRYQSDLCDEIGLMVYEESFAGWLLQDSPKMAERFDREVAEMIGRNRNHPSVVMWGLLNETGDGTIFRHATQMLPLVRSLDDSRLVMLNSGLVQFVGGANPGLGAISVWNGEANEPNITYNGTDEAINTLGIVWKPGQLALHPGANGEYAVARWTAPAAGEYRLAAKFTGIAQRATTDVHVVHQGKSLFDGLVNLKGQGNEAAFEKAISVKAGDAIDFAVGRGDGQYGGDCTAVAAAIQSPDNVVSDVAKDFSPSKNPNGSWTLGQYKAGDRPDASTFQRFPSKEEKKAGGTVGALSNPGTKVWEDVVSDQHPYKRAPHTAAIIRELRTMADGEKPLWLSEYGIGSGVDFARITRHFEQLGAEHCEDAAWYRQRLDAFMADWKRWRMEEAFASPEDFFAQSLAAMAAQRSLGLNAIRANPRVVGHSITGAVDQANSGEGLFTTFREMKPGTFDALFDGWYPLRWCLFVEPVNVYCGTRVKVEAVLANEDVLKPGEYPARFQVVGPDGKAVFDRHTTVTVGESKGERESPFAAKVFSEEVLIDGPAGKYRFLATFEHGAAAAGGTVEFFAADPKAMPVVDAEVVLWGEDAGLAAWLKERGIRTRPFSEARGGNREVILASTAIPSPGGAAAFRALAIRIARGDTVVFLSPAVFHDGKSRTGFVPLAKKGDVAGMPSWLYHKDDWAKRHPIFDGLPAGALMDYGLYREIIPDDAWVGLDTPAEAVAGATNTSLDYGAGLTVSVHSLGAGRFILNTLRVRENLGDHPVAERLLRNMLRYAAGGVSQPLAELPADFEEQLKSMGY